MSGSRGFPYMLYEPISFVSSSSFEGRILVLISPVDTFVAVIITQTCPCNTAIFHGCKNGNFLMKKCDIFLILLKT